MRPQLSRRDRWYLASLAVVCLSLIGSTRYWLP